MRVIQSLVVLIGLLALVFAQDGKKGVQVSVTDVEIFVSDSTDAIDVKNAKRTKVEYPNKIDGSIPAELFQHLFVNYKLKNKQSGAAVSAHQALLRIVNVDTQQETFVVSQYDSTTGYSAHVLVKDLQEEFTGGKDVYELHLIIGDSKISNPISWKLASNVNFKFNNSKAATSGSPFQVKPEIKHLFRPAEKRPLATISFAFTLAVLAPAALLLIGWPLVGGNLWNFPTGGAFIYAVGFQATIGAILGLYFLYWTALNMLQTLSYLGVLLVLLLFFGSKTLNHLATVSAAKSHTE